MPKSDSEVRGCIHVSPAAYPRSLARRRPSCNIAALMSQTITLLPNAQG